MDVFLVPVAAADYELYCEVPDAMPHADAPPRGLFRSLLHRFREMLAAAERERKKRLSGEPVEEPDGWWARLKARTLRWAAESIAEQRLLWHMRTCPHASLMYPSDLSESDARGALRASLSRDYDKHRRWFIIDLLGFIGSGVLMLVPGPNVLAYYFAFRLVGHYLSMRGARHALDHTEWRFCPSDELREIRPLVHGEAPDRDARLRAIQARLRLDHLASFVERMTAS
jgi:K+-H+ exchange-related protein